MITHKHWLTLILLLYLLLGAAYSWVVPLGEAPDEVDHFLYVRYLLEERAFPVMRPIAADNETMEANQPPLFYLLNAAVTAPFPMTASADLPLNACFTFDPYDGGRAHFYLHGAAEADPLAPDYLAFRVARLFSVLLGAVAVWLAYRLGRQLVPGDERVGLLAAGLLAFNPQFLFMMASVNNDVLTAVLGAAILTFSIQAALTPSPRLFALLGGLVGLGLLTKFALLAFWPLPVLAALWPVIREPLAVIRNPHSALRTPHSTLPNLLLVLILPLLIAGWWYVRAYLLYGDPLAWDVHLQAKGSEVLRTAPLTLADLRDFMVIHFQSYWAWFGWLKIKAPTWVYGLLTLFGAAAATGVILQIRDWRLEIKHSSTANLQSPIPNPQSPISLLFTLLAIAAIYASLLRYILTINWSGYQGRLAFAAAAPIAALLALGWWRVGKNLLQRDKGTKGQRAGNGVMALPVMGLAALALGSLFFLLAPAYARPALYAPPVEWTRVCRATAVSLTVEAYDAPGVILPGETLPLTIGGYGLTAGQAAAQAALLVGDAVVATTAVSPIVWTAQTPITFTLMLDTPPDMAPARARLLLYLDGEPVELGWQKIAPREVVTAVPTHPLSANFGDEVALLGYDLRQEAEKLYLTTYWQALRPNTTDYTLFAHLLDAGGTLLAQNDGLPQGGRYPTSIWDVGEMVVDERMIEHGVGETAVVLVIGLYDQVTQERLPVRPAGQPPALDGALRLPLIQP